MVLEKLYRNTLKRLRTDKDHFCGNRRKDFIFMPSLSVDAGRFASIMHAHRRNANYLKDHFVFQGFFPHFLLNAAISFLVDKRNYSILSG